MQFPSVKRKARRIPTDPKVISRLKEKIDKGFGIQMPPQKRLVEIYFDQKEMVEQAQAFFEYYEKVNWCSAKGRPLRNWKSLAGEWIFNFQQKERLLKRQREISLLQRKY